MLLSPASMTSPHRATATGTIPSLTATGPEPAESGEMAMLPLDPEGDV